MSDKKTVAAEVVVAEEVLVKQAEKEMLVAEKNMKKQLSEENHVDIFIAPTQLYPKGSIMPIGLNGVIYRVPVGIKFPKGVPESIAKIYDDSYEATEAAMEKMNKKLTGEITVE